MATPAICTDCGHERRYPARRGSLISQMACKVCDAWQTLARAGSYPSAKAQAAREVWSWLPSLPPGSLPGRGPNR
jgi:hypothetical protein